jgi:cytochrome P450
MLDFILNSLVGSYVIFFAKSLGALILLEVLVLRLPLFLSSWWHYKKQGVPFIKPFYPVIGNFLRLCEIMNKRGAIDYTPFVPMLKDTFGDANPPDVVVLMAQSQPMVVLNHPACLTDIYVTKNKYFDKDPLGRIIFGSFIGESIVLAASDEKWAKKRKVLSSAFFKDKLLRMTEEIREIVAVKIEEMEKAYLVTGKPMNLIQEIGDLHMRIILVSAFGLHDLHSVKLPYLKEGVTKYIPVEDFVKKLVATLIFKNGRYIFVLLPYLMFVDYCQEDREFAKNIKTMRSFCEKIIDDRKKNLEKYKDHPDVLSILLLDPLFENDNKAMIDEIITFFLAGSFTLKTTNSNLI